MIILPKIRWSRSKSGDPARLPEFLHPLVHYAACSSQVALNQHQLHSFDSLFIIVVIMITILHYHLHSLHLLLKPSCAKHEHYSLNAWSSLFQSEFILFHFSSVLSSLYEGKIVPYRLSNQPSMSISLFVMSLWPPLKETSNIKSVTLVARVIIKMGGLVSRHYSLWGQIRVASPGPSWHETGNSRPVILFVLLVIIIVIHSSSSFGHHRSGIIFVLLVIMCLCNIVSIITHCCALFLYS